MTPISRAGVIIGLSVLFSLPVQAQEEAVSPSIVEQVEAHNKKGVAHYEKGEFPEAIAEMLKAYQLIPEPGLLYNVARIYQKMNHERLHARHHFHSCFFIVARCKHHPKLDLETRAIKHVEFGKNIAHFRSTWNLNKTQVFRWEGW